MYNVVYPKVVHYIPIVKTPPPASCTSNRPASATVISNAMVSQPRPHGRLGGPISRWKWSGRWFLEDQGGIESTRNVDSKWFKSTGNVVCSTKHWWFERLFFWINIFGGIWTPSTCEFEHHRHTSEAKCSASLGTKDELVSSTVCVRNERWKKLGATCITEKEMQMCVFVSTIFSGRLATHRT